MAKPKKQCSKCTRNISPMQFYNTNSSLFSDNKVPFCKKCLRDMIDENDLESVYSVLRQIDKPFLITVWKKSKSSNNNTVGEYFKNINSLHQYRDKTWEDSIFDIVEDQIDEIEEDDIYEDGMYSMDELVGEESEDSIKVTKELKKKWGSKYSNRYIIEMEEFFRDMEISNEITTPQHKKELYFYVKLTVLANKALEDGEFGEHEKIQKTLDTLKKSAGFRPIDRKSGSEASGIRSFSQIFEEVEKDGFIEPYPVTERQDIVDRTIQYMTNYQLKLLNQEQLYKPPTDTPQLTKEEQKVLGDK